MEKKITKNTEEFASPLAVVLRMAASCGFSMDDSLTIVGIHELATKGFWTFKELDERFPLPKKIK